MKLLKDNFVVIVMILLVLSGIIYLERNTVKLALYQGYLYIKDSTTPLPDTFIVETLIVPEIKPHPHEIGDSLLDTDHHKIAPSNYIRIPKDMWVKEFRVTLENVDSDNLHHLVLSSTGIKDPLCSNYIFSPIFVQGSEQLPNPITFEKPYRVKLRRGDYLLLNAMFHNPFPPFGRGILRKNIRAKVTMKIDKDSSDKKRLQPFFFHIADPESVCNDNPELGQYFRIPANSKQFTRAQNPVETPDASQYQFPRAGKLILAEAHTHSWEGGKELNLYLNDKKLNTFIPKQADPQKTPWKWHVDQYKGQNVKINASDKLRIEAVYSNNFPVVIPDAMGMLLMYFAPN